MIKHAGVYYLELVCLLPKSPMPVVKPGDCEAKSLCGITLVGHNCLSVSIRSFPC